jgi:hypothetical protein
LTLAAACLTRYEAWLVAFAAIGLAGLALRRQGLAVRQTYGAVSRLALYPVVAIAAFMVHSRYTIGEWFVTGGFFVADNPAQGHLHGALGQVAWGVTRMTGIGFAIVAVAVACALAFRTFRGPRSINPPALVVLSLVGFIVVPWYAFFEGHPFRMRYMIAPAVAVAVFCGIAVGMLRRPWRAGAAAVVGMALVFTARPFDRTAPMLLEAQWDRANSLERRAVTECLMRGYHGEPILISMGSLAHYMQEMSHEGLNIRDFVHEGNRPFWPDAVKEPRGRVGWILVEEKAEGGDVLSLRARESPLFLNGFRRVCEGGGVVLYRAYETID